MSGDERKERTEAGDAGTAWRRAATALDPAPRKSEARSAPVAGADRVRRRSLGLTLDDRPPTAHGRAMGGTRTTEDAPQGKSARFRSRPSNAGWLVLDTWTGEPASIGGMAQVGLSKLDADHTAALLQRQVSARD